MTKAKVKLQVILDDFPAELAEKVDRIPPDECKSLIDSRGRRFDGGSFCTVCMQTMAGAIERGSR